MRIVDKPMPDRSRHGLSTTASGIAQQGHGYIEHPDAKLLTKKVLSYIIVKLLKKKKMCHVLSFEPMLQLATTVLKL